MNFRCGLLSSVIGFLTACNAGGGNVNVTAQVMGGSNGTVWTGNSCRNMTTGSTCNILLTLNNNGVSQLNLTASALPAPFTNNPNFSYGVAACQDQIDGVNNVQVQCPITLTYHPSTLGPQNSVTANLTFTLGNAVNSPTSSSAITLSGN